MFEAEHSDPTQQRGSPSDSSDGGEIQCSSAMLARLVRKQIENSLRESAPKSMDVTNAVLELGDHLRRLADAGQGDSDRVHVLPEVHNLSKSMNQALIGLQFYDRLAQQLSQAARTLEQLESMLSTRDRETGELDCSVMAKALRNRYPTESERAIFDEELSQKSSAVSGPQKLEDGPGIEFFDWS